jgi:hypothetical protein
MYSNWSHSPGAEVTRAVDVVWRVANHDELLRWEIHLQLFTNTLRRTRRQVATVVRLIPESAWKRKEFFESHQFHL